MIARFLLAAVLLLASWWWWSYKTPDNGQNTGQNLGVPRRTLMRNAWRADTWLLTYFATDEIGKEQLRNALLPLEKYAPDGVTLRILPADEVPDSLLGKHPLILIGNAWPKQWNRKITTLPNPQWHGGQIQLDTLLWGHPGQLAWFTGLPNPWNSQQWPFHLVWSKNVADVVAFITQRWRQEDNLGITFWSAWGYELLDKGQLCYQGHLNDSTWAFQPNRHLFFQQGVDTLLVMPHATLLSMDGARPELPALEQAFLKHYEQLQQLIDEPLQVAQCPVYFYPSVEKKALRTRRMEDSHTAPDGSVHLVCNNIFDGAEWGDHLLPCLTKTWGDPQKAPWIALGLGLLSTQNLRGKPWTSWAGQLASANMLIPATDLNNEEVRQWYGAPTLRISAAAWVDFILQTRGAGTLKQCYQGKLPASTLVQWQAEAQAWWKQHYPTLQTPVQVPLQGFQKGFTLAHEGYRIFNGYGSAEAANSLAYMANVGIDAVAVVPYSFMEYANKPSPIPVVASAGSENDQSVVFAHAQAKMLGQRTLLKPQIWLGHGSWPGDVKFEKEEDWQAFFIYYRRWIMHYALLAELYGFDAFCIGTELRYTTLQRPDDWERLIQDIRKVYSGTLTYAANWGEECEKMRFWSQLDYIGVNCYYPLHKDSTATEAQLRSGIAGVFAKIQAIHSTHGKPVWFTEVGFRSATTPWLNPHAEAGERKPDVQAQALCYQILLDETIRHQDWLKGLFWWKWPTTLDYNEDQGRGYMPLGKPAEKIVATYYHSKL